MRFTISYSAKTDAAIIFQALEQIQKGSYQRKGILLLDQPKIATPIPTAYLPVLAIKNKGEIPQLTNDQVITFTKEWSRWEQKIQSILSTVMGKIYFSEVLLHPTQYGVRGWQKASGKTLEIWHRVDFPVEYIAVTLVEAIIFDHLSYRFDLHEPYEGHSYNYKASVLDFLFSKTPLIRIVPNYKGLAQQMDAPEVDATLLQSSSDNYKLLGYPANSTFEIQDDDIVVNGDKLTFLTQNQTVLLKLLINNTGRVITFEKVARALWTDNSAEKFSLTAISKAIFDLRAALKAAGLQKEFIYTKRKVGYWLQL